ncbi:hypothetical protein HMPREF0491_02790 [Lachnospiraceae oral taxon 107 str. F0167]|nr:hypothetical protein HMPREF0491_02790 [Lachnospiraceae oral taxon 107 str. F0167]
MLNKHQFWAVVAMVAMVMCMITGHSITSKHKPKVAAE